MPEVRVGPNSVVKYDTSGLDALLAASEEKFVVRVGILGSKAAAKHERREAGELKNSGGHKLGENKSELSNADIGLRHEKGVKSEKLPRRSWLVTPLEDHLPDYFQQIGQEAIHLIISQQNQKNYEMLGVICLQIIIKGFETDGYGKWKPLSRMTVELKKSSRILVDTGQLKKAVAFDVVTK